MSYNDWKDKTASFKKIDVRGVQGNFFPGLKMQATKMAVGEYLINYRIKLKIREQ